MEQPDLAPSPRLRRVVVAAAALLAIHNLFPYLGLRYESCQTMFSDLVATERRNNHLFLPQLAVSDAGAYRRILSAETRPPPSDPQLRYLARWLAAPTLAREPGARDDRAPANPAGRLYSVEAIRAAVSRLCRAGLAVRLSYREPEGRPVTLDDACAAWPGARPCWTPVRRYPPQARWNLDVAR